MIPPSSLNPHTILGTPTRYDCAHHFCSLYLHMCKIIKIRQREREGGWREVGQIKGEGKIDERERKRESEGERKKESE